MDWNEYCAFTKTTASYPKTLIGGLSYVAHKLVGELGELIMTTDAADRMVELGDVCWYVAEYHNVLGLNAEANWQLVQPPWFGSVDTVKYHVLPMVSGINELVGKVLRRDELRPSDRTKFEGMGITLMLLVKAMCELWEYDLGDIMVMNMDKLTVRKNEGTIVDEAKRTGTL